MTLPASQQCFLGLVAVIVSPVMRRVMELVERNARSQASVLITGETRSGKEIVARAIHHFSLRSAKPWVDVNCAALPDQTLFLDEIGELEPRMQVKLLRVLDGVPYFRVGGQKKVQVNTRILAATNQDLETAVRQGRFRSDLYHRLNQCQLRVPPLRERVEDIVPLAEHFLKQQTDELSFTDEAKRALRSHAWPGNARELRNVVIASTLRARGRQIEVHDLATLVSPGRGSSLPRGNLRLDGLERDAILAALCKTAGHHQQAADLLGISRRTLSRKLKVYEQDGKEEAIYAVGQTTGS